VRGPWNAWGFTGPSPNCPENYPVRLVSGVDAGLIEVDPESSTALLTGYQAGRG
jgi:hypothetical protein